MWGKVYFIAADGWICMSGSECLCVLETLTECDYTRVFIVIKNANLGRLCNASQWGFVKFSALKSFAVYAYRV